MSVPRLGDLHRENYQIPGRPNTLGTHFCFPEQAMNGFFTTDENEAVEPNIECRETCTVLQSTAQNNVPVSGITSG